MSRPLYLTLGFAALAILFFTAEEGNRAGLALTALVGGAASILYLYFRKIRPARPRSTRTVEEIERERELIASFDKTSDS